MLTASFGYYKFSNLGAGGTYIVNVQAKRFWFPDPMRVLSVQDNLNNVDFVASTLR